MIIIGEWCMLNYININITKTKFCVYGKRSHVKLYRDEFIVHKDQKIMRCQQYNYLGVFLDECLNLDSNFDNIFKKFSHKVFQFGKIKKYINNATRILVYKQTILPLVEYVSFLLCLNSKHDVDKLQKLQNRCLRMCLDIQNHRDFSVVRLHEITRISKLDVRREIQLLNIMYYLKCENQFKRNVIRDTRSIDRYVFETDIVHTSIYAKSPYFIGVSLWNDLPKHAHTMTDKYKFKDYIKRHLTVV